MSETIPLSPSVFTWLYTTSGCTKKELVDTLPKSLERNIDSWLAGTRTPNLTISQIQKLATLFHRPFSSFLLSEIPEGELIPRDFRKNPGSKPFSKEVYRYFRQAHNDLSIYQEMSENLNEEYLSTVRSYSITDNPELVAEKERDLFKIPADIQWKDEQAAYKYWRDLITSSGILVFQYSMPQDEARGFVIRSENVAAIITNSKDGPASRSFTIFHEYAHLLIGEECVCVEDSEDSPDPDIQQIENWCNQFAGAFLAPKQAVLSIPNLTTLLASGRTEEAAGKLSRKFRISRTASLVRLRKLNLINNTQYRKTYSLLNPEPDDEEEEEKEEQERKPIFISPADICLREKGIRYIQIIERNYNEGHITQKDRMHNLNLSQKNADRLREKVGLS